MLARENRVGMPITLCLLLALLALGLRLYGLSDKPLWLDEILTLKRASLPLGELVIDALRNKHYPTYFILVGPFATADFSEWTLRFPSAVLGAVSVLFVALLADEVRGPRASLMAGLLMALSPFEVQFGQEARSYTLISCLVLIAIWGLVRIAKQPEAAAVPLSRSEALRGTWAAYVLGTIGALVVQNIAIPWLLVSNLAMLAILRRAAFARIGLLRNWIWAQGIILLLWLPALIVMLSINQGDILAAIRWVPETTWENIRMIVGAVYLFRVSDLLTFVLLPAPFPEFGIGVAALALLGVLKLRTDPVLVATIGLAFLAMPVSIAILSAFQPALVPRFLMWSTGPYFVLAGIGAATVPRKVFPLIAVFVTVGGAVSLAPYYSAETKPRWDQAAAYLTGNARPNDVIVARSPLAAFVLRSYAERFRLESNIPILASNPGDPAGHFAVGLRIWVVYGRVGQGALESEAEFRQKWFVIGMPAEEIRFGSNILILRFELS